MFVSSPMSLTLDERDICDVALLLNGAFAPLTGYPTQEEYQHILHHCTLPDGQPFPMPLALIVDDHQRKALEGKDRVSLRDGQGREVAILNITSIWRFDAQEQARVLFQCVDERHPWIHRLCTQHGQWALGGVLEEKQGIDPHYWGHEFQSPEQVRAQLKEKGWNHVVAFQTRNPLHRSHFELTLWALSQLGEDAGLLVHPVIGPTQPGDVPVDQRVACYHKIMSRYPQGRAQLSLLPLAMRMAGPREALWHALIRRNYGATHFIVGRDHAGPSVKKDNGQPFFDPYQAQEQVLFWSKKLGIIPVVSQAIGYYPQEKRYFPADQAPQGQEPLSLSGTKLRGMLAQGQRPPEWFTFPEVADILMAPQLDIAAHG